MTQQMSCLPLKGACHRVHLKRPLPTKTKGVKHWDCDFISLYENVPARVGESRTIEENRLDDSNPPPRYGSDKADERVIMLAPRQLLSNLKPGDWLGIPWGTRPNMASPVPLLSGIGPYLWIETPNGPELLMWTCQADGTCSFQGATITIAMTTDGRWCMQYEGTEHCFATFNFACNVFPDGYSFINSTGPDANYKILKIDPKEDHLCRVSHYSVFAEFLDQEGITIQ